MDYKASSDNSRIPPPDGCWEEEWQVWEALLAKTLYEIHKIAGVEGQGGELGVAGEKPKPVHPSPLETCVSPTGLGFCTVPPELCLIQLLHMVKGMEVRREQVHLIHPAIVDFPKDT